MKLAWPCPTQSPLNSSRWVRLLWLLNDAPKDVTSKPPALWQVKAADEVKLLISWIKYNIRALALMARVSLT